ncbi:hypothetical protein [Roseibium aggregatum]|uniref:Uncharacterized protein n=1 Tax=Roseibium aggregatum TaxID=187304 RepID=A0A926P166_9HYPH|nr:hypothetical protein [Roseibium aggregatum]MBD1549329.1 hypothetical protein [Roseibium aggregatum]
MSAMTIRFLVQAGFGTVGVLVIVFGGWPWGAGVGTALIIFGLWLGGRIFRRIATLDEIKADLRQRVDEGP